MFTHTVSKALTLAIAALALQLPTSTAGAEDSAETDEVPCDPELEPDGIRRGYAYRPSSNVCEGYYTRQASSARVEVEVVSFLAGKFPSGEDRVQISAPADHIASFLDDRARISVRAQPRERGIYYRMDTVLEESGQKEWSLDDVVNLNEDLSEEDALGIFGWVEGENGESTYVPLRVASLGTGWGPSHSRDSPKLVMRAVKRPERIIWSLYDHRNRNVLLDEGEITTLDKAEFEIPLPKSPSEGPVSQLDLEIEIVHDGEFRFHPKERLFLVR